MAKEPQAKSPNEALKSEAIDRLADCKTQKGYHETDLIECYKFAAPRRTVTDDGKRGDASLLATSLGFEVAEDLMTKLFEAFMPEQSPWVMRLAPPFANKGDATRIQKIVAEQDVEIFKFIRESLFYAELAKQGVPDASIGVLAMHIHDVRGDMPVRCVAVPIRKLEMNMGPDGRIDDRFVCEKVKYRALKAVVPQATLTKEIETKVKDHPNKEADVQWGYWRLWDKTDDEYWQHVVMIDKEVCHSAVLKGQGCCPLVIGRLNATPDYVWPEGPMIKALPDLRQYDDLRVKLIENIDFTLRPPMACDDDSLPEGTLVPGDLVARRPRNGAGNTYEKIYEPNPINAALFEVTDLERRIRRLHYSDFPQQPGKTPPTAQQWVDELVEAQRKIGTPGFAFWSEFPRDVFARFVYIAEARRRIVPVMHEGSRVPLQAYNPAQKAQENQQVQTALRFLQAALASFPSEAQVLIDAEATMRKIKEKLGDELVTFRTPQQLTEAVGRLSQLSGLGAPATTGGIQAAA